jgi:hypothetical protein
MFLEYKIQAILDQFFLEKKYLKAVRLKKRRKNTEKNGKKKISGKGCVVP